MKDCTNLPKTCILLQRFAYTAIIRQNDKFCYLVLFCSFYFAANVRANRIKRSR